MPYYAPLHSIPGNMWGTKANGSWLSTMRRPHLWMCGPLVRLAASRMLLWLACVVTGCLLESKPWIRFRALEASGCSEGSPAETPDASADLYQDAHLRFAWSAVRLWQNLPCNADDGHGI